MHLSPGAAPYDARCGRMNRSAGYAVFTVCVVGWIELSVAYHGDDGMLHYGGDAVEFGPTFGAGDVVGCGILLPPLVPLSPSLFFTLNGRLLGNMFDLRGLLEVSNGSFAYPVIVRV